MADNYVPNNKKKVVRKSAMPFYVAAAVYLIYALLFAFKTILGFALCLILTIAAFSITEKKAPSKEEYVEKSEKELSTGDDATDSLLKQGRKDLDALKQYGVKVEGEDIKQKLYKITTTGDKILDYVHDHPKSASKVRQFLNYFLPTTKKLMDNYMMLTAQGASGDNINQTKTKIESMLLEISSAFDKQLDALFADTAIDVMADIAVMQGLMGEKEITVEESAEEDGGIQLQL